MKELRDLARQLLTDGTVNVVIGWEDGPRGARPIFAADPDDADKLIFDTRCVHNLATYLNPRRKQVAGLGKLALVVKGCDAKAVAGLLREAQLTRERVVLIGVRCGGVCEDSMAPAARGAHARDGGAALLRLRRPRAAPRRPPRRRAAARAAGAAPHARRARRGARGAHPRAALGVLDGAVRQVHALLRLPPGLPAVRLRALRRRQEPAAVDRDRLAPARQPRLARDPRHAPRRPLRRLRRVRALLPGRHPARLLNRKLQQVVEERYDYRVSDDPEVPAPIGDFRLDDQQEFIK